jgi:hypothetical protein
MLAKGTAQSKQLKDAQLFVARQLAQPGKQDKTFRGGPLEK